MEGCEEKHVLPQGWRVTKLKYCDYKEILLQRLKVTRLEVLEEKQVLPQGWRVRRLGGWEKKQVLRQFWRVSWREGCGEMQDWSQSLKFSRQTVGRLSKFCHRDGKSAGLRVKRKRNFFRRDGE